MPNGSMGEPVILHEFPCHFWNGVIILIFMFHVLRLVGMRIQNDKLCFASCRNLYFGSSVGNDPPCWLLECFVATGTSLLNSFERCRCRYHFNTIYIMFKYFKTMYVTFVLSWCCFTHTHALHNFDTCTISYIDRKFIGHMNIHEYCQ